MGYYTAQSGMTVKDFVQLWVEGEKAYDSSFPIMMDVEDLWHYRDYTWNSKFSRGGYAWPFYSDEGKLERDSNDFKTGEKKWDTMLLSMDKYNWDDREPLHLYVGKDGKAKIGEGNHRLAIWRKLSKKEVPTYVHFVPVIYETHPGISRPPQVVENFSFRNWLQESNGLDRVYMDHPYFGKETVGEFLSRNNISVTGNKIVLYHGRPKGSNYKSLKAGSYVIKDPKDAAFFAARDRGLDPNNDVEVIRLELSPDDIEPGIHISLRRDISLKESSLQLETKNFDQRYSLWLNIVDKLRPWDKFYKVVANNPDGVTEKGTTAISFALGKEFKSSEQAKKWLDKNLPNFQFTVDSYAIVLNGDIVRFPTYDYQFPFQWVKI